MRSIALLLLVAASPVFSQTRPLPAAVNQACAEAAPDTDGDGLGDECELKLAQYFAPVLLVHSGGCNWDDSVSPARLGGGYLFAVQPTAAGARVAYLPAYYRDCGWKGIKCLLPFVDCAPHLGDSEFILIEARRAQDAWATDSIFLSAHCFGKHDRNCRWYAGDELDDFEWEGAPRGAPFIWVAEGRHAHYPSKKSCDRGIYRLDTCDHNSVSLVYPIVSHMQNIGSLAAPAHENGCVRGQSIWTSQRESTEAIECFWDANKLFAGWQLGDSGVTPYHRYLVEIADF